jgi:hypothetical protein
MWLIRRKQATLLTKVADGTGYIVDVERFHASLQSSLNDYLTRICEPASATCDHTSGRKWMTSVTSAPREARCTKARLRWIDRDGWANREDCRRVRLC